MRIIKDLSHYKSSFPIALSLGMFDGVHLGHISIIDTLTKISKEKNYSLALFSFWSHPKKILNPSLNLNYLTTLEEKTFLLEKRGIDILFLQNFNLEFRCLDAERFVEEILVKKLNTKYIMVGHNHYFGKDKKGNFKLLKEMGNTLGFEVEQQEAININSHHISSSKIREALLNGNIQEANEMLGYHYPISGKIIHGKKIGRTIGYPTANILVDETKLLPKKGAYIVEVWIKEVFYKGMLSIGTNPTVGDNNKLSVEVHILDFQGDIYGEYITLKIRQFLHEEIKFENLKQLIQKLDEDKDKTGNFSF